MGKKKGGKKMIRQDDDYDTDDVISLASADTAWTDEGDEIRETEVVKENGLEAAIEELTEKRTTTREAAMMKILSLLLQYLPADAISDTLVDNILNCLRKPSEKLGINGCRALAIVGLILGPDEERYFQRANNVLEPLAKSARNVDLKAAALQALAIICTVCSVEDENTTDLMGLFQTYFDLKYPTAVCTQALEAWGLLASTLSDYELADEDFIDRVLPQFLALFDHTDVDVRSAAGENVALLHEAAQKCGHSLPYDDEIIDKLQAMSKITGKKNSKKDRKVQRSVFRDILATVENGESPQLTLLVKANHMEIQSWKSIRRYETIKTCLGSGLQEHIKFNNNVRYLLDLPECEEVVPRGDIIDKKSLDRKQRTNALKDDRRRKQNLQDHFINEY